MHAQMTFEVKHFFTTEKTLAFLVVDLRFFVEESVSLFSIVVFVLLDAGEAGSSRGRLADVDGSWLFLLAVCPIWRTAPLRDVWPMLMAPRRPRRLTPPLPHRPRPCAPSSSSGW